MAQLISIKNTLTSIQNISGESDHHTDLDSDVGAAGLLNNTFSHTGRKPQYVSLAGGTDDNAPTDANFKLHFLNLQMTKSLMFH